MILHDMFPLAIVFPVKPETNLLIKLDCMGIILIHAKIYRAALILCMQSVKKRKHRLFSISFSLISFINEQPIQP